MLVSARCSSPSCVRWADRDEATPRSQRTQRSQRRQDKNHCPAFRCGLCVLCDLGVAPKRAIARFVRQTRTITYEKSAAAESFFTRFQLKLTPSARISRACLRQTRNISESSEALAHDKCA